VTHNLQGLRLDCTISSETLLERPVLEYNFVRLGSVTEGGEIVFHRSAWGHADTFATLAVGMQVKFEPESSPKGRRTAKITVMP
jgi:cold shock CspA family protein